jgi:hypothetical protein
MQHETYSPDKYIYIISIDIGVRNLGVCLLALYPSYKLHEVVWIKHVDLTVFTHEDGDEKNCSLYHTKTYCDYLAHFFHTYKDLFSIATTVLIERQPLNGYVVVEQLIFSQYRDKAVLISPNSLHAFMGWQNYDYEKRKHASEAVLRKWLEQGTRPYLIDEWKSFPRQHDIADALCIALYYGHKKHLQWQKQEQKKKIQKEIQTAKENGLFHSHIFLEQFRFNGFDPDRTDREVNTDDTQ